MRQNGTGMSAHNETYDSTAFFVKEAVTGLEKEFLFFGDVEPGKSPGRGSALETDAAAHALPPPFDRLHLEATSDTSSMGDCRAKDCCGKAARHLSRMFISCQSRAPVVGPWHTQSDERFFE